MTEEEFAGILSLGHESRGVEFKGPGSLRDNQLRAKVVLAVLGMANRRDGGLVVVGVCDEHGKLQPVGLEPEDLATWRYDDVADAISQYAEPSVTFDLAVYSVSRRKYVALHVREFEDVPILCKRLYPDVLRPGACYVRSRRKPETTEIPTQEDMRELIELAAEKRLRRFLAMAQASGIKLQVTQAPTDEERYEAQIKDLR